ncbi:MULTISPECIES: mannitol dehydrogenase family protein [Falsihalocynthiibacter]|uniref:mannitol dehydrogenase family protein n=1 Tax=Falsihalocynthiibacter TaxID=2854182 RepID=UPI003001B818
MSLQMRVTIMHSEPCAYDPSASDVGIVHIGIGAFHRAHQAVYTDSVLAKNGGDWRILGVSLRSTEVADAMNAQEGRYTLVVRSDQRGEPPVFREIGSVASVLAGQRGVAPILDAMTRPQTRIVSLTITEKAYGVDLSTGQLNLADPQIAKDLANPELPTGAIGLITRALAVRRASGTAPFTVLSCDNLPNNGALVRAGVLEFAHRVDPDLASWISVHVRFPSTMVDRITPASSDSFFAEVEQALGHPDLAAVETEPFSQWVIEDDFCNGRPAWEDAGAILVQDVEPFEKMKLRMLNGAHSMLAYAGYLSGCTYVRDVMDNPRLAKKVAAHLQAASETLTPLEGVDFNNYATELIKRFGNPNIAHETYQIAMDGTQKMRQRIFEPAAEVLAKGGDIDTFAFATACWIRYASGRHDSGTEYALRDPREEELADVYAAHGQNAESLVKDIFALPNLLPAAVAKSETFAKNVTQHLQKIRAHGVLAAI